MYLRQNSNILATRTFNSHELHTRCMLLVGGIMIVCLAISGDQLLT